MTLSTFLRTIFAFLQTGTAKSLNAKTAEENIQAEESTIAESALNVSEQEHLTGGRLMTKTEAVNKLVNWCKAQIGYHEGYDGSNKFADGQWDTKLYGFSALQVPWCDVFVDAAYISCFGFNDATAMTYQQPSGYAACSLSADAYKRNGAFYTTPEAGDQIFFYAGGGINHTGIVIDVEGETVVCVEGNYSDSVARTQYRFDNNAIAGYGRPDWAVVANVPEEPVKDEFDNIHPKHRRAFLHLSNGDGLNYPLPQVRAWQALLQCWGFVLDVDGEFGNDTENATRQWQRAAQEIGADVEVNGIVDEDDWKEIIKILVEGECSQ